MKRKWLYEISRKTKNGFTETIIAWEPCKGWKTIRKIPYEDMSRCYLC